MPESNSPSQASVVVAAYNEERWIARSLASLAVQTHPSYEVIVVDDGSRDATAAIARRAGARVVSTAHRGAGHARRVGTEAADGYSVVGYGEGAELGRLLGEADVVGEARFAFTLPTGTAEIFRKSRWIGRGPRFARERPSLWHLSPPVSLLRTARRLAGGHARPAFVHLLYDAGRLIGFYERRLRPHVAAVA